MPRMKKLSIPAAEGEHHSQPDSVRASRYEDGFRVLQGNLEFVTYQENSSFRMWYSDVPWRYENHYHSAVEIVLPQSGWVDYTVQDQLYHVHKDEVLIVPPQVPHGLSMEQGSSRLLYLFEPQILDEMRDIRAASHSFSRVFYLHDFSETHTRIRELLEKAAESYRSQEAMWNTVCFSCVLQIYALLGQEYVSQRSLRDRRQENVIETQVISTAMNYINAHYQRELTLDEVANFVGFNRYYFSRSFKIQTGYTFKDYLSQKRVQAAMELLMHTKKPMHEVAEESGFGSIATFNRVFRDSKGCTPTQYRTIYGEY